VKSDELQGQKSEAKSQKPCSANFAFNPPWRAAFPFPCLRVSKICALNTEHCATTPPIRDVAFATARRFASPLSTRPITRPGSGSATCMYEQFTWQTSLSLQERPRFSRHTPAGATSAARR